MKVVDRIAEVLAVYSGRAVSPKSLLVVADPVFSDVYAVRWTKYDADFIISMTGSLEENVEAVEEGLFDSWPPVPVHQN